MESFISTTENVDQGQSRRYMFTAELNGTIGTKSDKKDGSESSTSNTFTWDPSTNDKMYKNWPFPQLEGLVPGDSIHHALVIRRVVLGPSAKADEENWINVDVSHSEGNDASFPLACLVRGKENQTLVDLEFPSGDDVRVKFTLAEGTGPVHVIGFHMIETLQNDSQAEEYDEEDEIEDEEANGLVADASEAPKAPAIRAKRRMNGDNANGDPAIISITKKIKTDGTEEVAMEEATNGNAKKET